MESSQYCLEVRTVQSSAFKTLIEALKEILTDSNIEFDENGIKIVAMDSSHVVLVHMKLDASKFEYYNCVKKQLIGVNILNLFKLVKTMNTNDTLTLFMEKEDTNYLGIRIETPEKNQSTTYKLNLMDLPVETISIPPATFHSIITLPSSDFQKICRDMNNLADFIDIKNIGDQLLFSCLGDFCSQETIITENSQCMNLVKNDDSNEIIQGVFNLRYLVLFTKCTNLCGSVELYLKNDYPLILKYAVASLGEIKLCLAPQSSTQ